MRLKKLIVQGFKSFADRTEFVFDSPITGIVGPNGCGKSNVVDAFKWVLGEQSAKSLRGDAMLDVIFNGSGNRKPSGMAEVVLVFENPPRPDGTRLLNLDADEVHVGRRLFRDGTSEYQLNNTGARLKDVRELFLDTGVGVDAYSVIEQGRVAALLEANPAERRLIFEEAAGISKFKQKKKESQRKLERVDQNLLRVTDIVEEVEKRLRSVKAQAGRARTFQEHSTRLRELRLTYALQEYHTLHGQREQLVSEQGKTQAKLEEIATTLYEEQLALSELRHEFDSLSQQRQRGEYELVQTKAAIHSAQQRQQYATQQLQQIAEQLAQFEQDREGLSNKSADVTDALSREEASYKALTEDLAARRTDIEGRQKAFHDTQLALNQINREIEQNKGAILDLMRRSSQVANRLGAIEIERKNIASQQQRLGQRRQVVLSELEVLEAARTELDAALAAALAEIAALQAQIEESTREAAALGKQISEISQQLGSAREHRSGLVSRQRLLEDLEKRCEGFTEGVKALLRQREQKFPFIRGVVADLLRVDVEHAQVIEAALDGRDQMLIADSHASVLAARDAFASLEGRVNILCADEAKASASLADYDWNQHPQRIRLAIDLVRVEPENAAIACQLLGTTVVVDTLEDALDLHRTGPAGWRYVTKDGAVVEPHGTVRVGPLTAAMGLISRRSELESLAHQIADADRRVEELTAQVSEGNAQAKAMQERQNTLRNGMYQANTRKVETTSRITQNTDKQTSLRRELPVVERELQNFLDQVGRLKTEEDGLLEKRRLMEEEQTSRQQKVEELAKKHQEDAENLKQWAEALTSLRVELGQVQEKQLAAQQAVQRLSAAKTELAQQIDRVSRTAAQVASRRANVESELDTAKEAEGQLTRKQEQLSKQVESLGQQVAELRDRVESLTEEVETTSAEHAEVEQALHRLALQVNEARVRLEGLVQRTLDELQLDLPARYAELDQQGGYQPAEMDWAAVAEEIKQLREKIQRLGNVNLDAINEQDELEQRQQFLATQVNDLRQSKLQLEQLIDEINKESSVRFEQTFNAVREHFQGMFRKLFGGGKADIFLATSVEDPDAQPVLGPDGQPTGAVMKKTIDPLEAGIEIMAHPPGKKPVSITQLSGGEKTMTCVALLMSIFKSKPSPFCILDEVDAALDEANNQRFNLIVQEFLEQSQFIVITHSKRTMQIADVLYGVTMQEQGVSKRVAVRFDQVDSQGRMNEHAAA